MILAPSILAADLGHLADQISAVERGGAGMIHVDVMDGRFVPNISLGPAVVEACRRATHLPVDVHLMVESAERYLDAFADAGASSISVHVEALPHLQRAIAHLRGRGVKAGVALNPSTPLGSLEEILPEVDFVLVMSVNPGFGGQAFLPRSASKVRALRALLDRVGSPAAIEIDGGIDLDTVEQVVRAGAEILVAGSSIFHAPDAAEATRVLKTAAQSAARGASASRA